MAHALWDIGRFTYSRWFLPLVFALRAGRNSVIADIAFCDTERRKEAERVMNDAVHNIDCQWIFFEHAPEACRQNIERRARQEARSLDEPLKALWHWSRMYQVPTGASIIPVYRGLGVPKEPHEGSTH